MTLFIIGGTGFFGKSILDSFLRGKLKSYDIDDVVVLARNIDRFLNIYPEFNFQRKIHYIKGDIKTIGKLPYADIVIHAATSTNQTHYKLNSSIERLNIELGASNYIKIAKKIHNNSKIVYCSSGAVYGKQPDHILKIKEDYPLQDLDEISLLKKDYALGKRNAEKLVLKSGEAGLNFSIARCFAFYGKYLPKDGHFAYSSFLESAKNGKDIIVNANHEVIRSYMHADNLVESLIKIALNSNPSCPIYNVGSDQAISIFDLAEEIAEKHDVKVIKKEQIDYDNVDRYVPNTDKLKRLG